MPYISNIASCEKSVRFQQIHIHVSKCVYATDQRPYIDNVAPHRFQSITAVKKLEIICVVPKRKQTGRNICAALANCAFNPYTGSSKNAKKYRQYICKSVFSKSLVYIKTAERRCAKFHGGIYISPEF